MDLLAIGAASLIGYHLKQTIQQKDRQYTIVDNTQSSDFKKKVRQYDKFPQKESRNAGTRYSNSPFVERLTIGNIGNRTKTEVYNKTKPQLPKDPLFIPSSGLKDAEKLMMRHSSDMTHPERYKKKYDNHYLLTHKIAPIIPNLDDLRTTLEPRPTIKAKATARQSVYQRENKRPTVSLYEPYIDESGRQATTSGVAGKPNSPKTYLLNRQELESQPKYSTRQVEERGNGVSKINQSGRNYSLNRQYTSGSLVKQVPYGKPTPFKQYDDTGKDSTLFLKQNKKSTYSEKVIRDTKAIRHSHNPEYQTSRVYRSEGNTNIRHLPKSSVRDSSNSFNTNMPSNMTLQTANKPFPNRVQRFKNMENTISTKQLIRSSSEGMRQQTKVTNILRREIESK